MSGASKANIASRAEEKETEVVRRFNRGRLLLAEDNTVNQQVALAILEIEGYAVTLATNGLEAVAAFSSGTFDAILMDCHMPEMDGFEATRRIREMEKLRKLERTPIIALTANAMQQDRDECLIADMDDHLSKPYTRAQMRTMLELWVPVKAADPALAGRVPALASPEPAAACGAVIDRTALDGMREIERSGKANMVKRLIDSYLTDAPKLIRAIKQAAEADNRPDLARAAHTLKSSSANLGALGLSNLCGELELTARNANGDTRQLVADVESLYCSVQTALAAELATCAA
jgi:Response regulators consisting of a CheY-like receiver domain and a winged-helix DNA-binding domain